ncbi:single-strand DNA endonuclease ASTE1 [Stigmatopora nigra]
MGVQGLTTFIEGNRNFLSDVKFRGNRLIIDGSSLFFNLFLNYFLDRSHGGDYDAFASLVLDFFSALSSCNIQPYVLLDGGMDPSDKKFETLQQRFQSRIKQADNMSQGGNGSILPIYTRHVFIEVLIQEKVHFVQCPAEADWDIACLAHEWGCPLLSNDSDFFIFDLPGGYMPLNFFQWTNLKGKASQRSIPARCYTTQVLCSFYQRMNPDLLPLCAVLLGNDYGAPAKTCILLELINKSARNINHRNLKTPSSRIDVLLRWLSSFSSLAEALAEVRRLMRENADGLKKKPKDGLSSHLEELTKEYHVTPRSPLTCWFAENKIPEGYYHKTIPHFLLKAVAQGLVSPFVIDALVMRKVLLFPQVENSRNPSSHCCARAIRQAVYGILLLDGKDPTADKSPQLTVFVREFDRVNLNRKMNKVQVQCLKSHFHLNTLNKVPEAIRCEVIFEVLKVNPATLANVPANMRLAVAVTGFWMQEATPKPSHLQLQALIMGMVYGEILFMEKSGIVCYQIPAPISKSQWAEEHAFMAFMDHRRLSSKRRLADMAAAYSFNQWQACLWSALCLNQLLLGPLQQGHLSRLFIGTLVHGFLGFLKEGGKVNQVLTEVASIIYSTLINAVKNCGPKVDPCPVKEVKGQGGGRRGRGRQSRGRGGRRDDQISNRFAVLEMNR